MLDIASLDAVAIRTVVVAYLLQKFQAEEAHSSQDLKEGGRYAMAGRQTFGSRTVLMA